MGITDQLLMAYVDGELSPDLAALILSRLETEPDFLEKIEQHQQLRQQLTAAYGSIITEPLSPGLTALLAREGRPTPSRQPAPGLAIVQRLSSDWPLWAVAAATVIGVGLLEARHASDPIARSGDGRLLAAGPLARSLEHDLTADAMASDIKIMASFQDRGERYCRVFEGVGRDDGVACKEPDGRWQVVALAASAAPAPAQGYRQASSALASPVAAAVDELQGAETLTPDQERQARTQQWRVGAKGGSKSS